MRWLIALGFALLLLGLASACITYPTLEVGAHNFIVEIQSIRSLNGLPNDYPTENLTAEHFDTMMAKTYLDGWPRINLTSEEKATIWEFIKNGYSVRRMKPVVYAEFLRNASATNADPTTCDHYPAVAYATGFMGYVLATDKYEDCPVYRCSPIAYVPFLNDLDGAATIPSVPTGGIAEDAPSPFPREPESDGWQLPSIFDTGSSSAPPDLGATPSPAPSADTSYIGYLSAGAIAIILFAGAVAFSIMMRRPHEDLGIDEMTVHRTLSSSTRAALLRELVQRDLTPTDLSAKVGKSKATVVEHLDKLIDARLVEKIERDGRKFVFYRLTPKGKAVLRRAG